MALLFILTATLLGGLAWYTVLPRAETVVAAAPAHHITQRGGAVSAVTCRRLTPPRQEEAEFARFYVGCTDAETADRHIWIYAWHSKEDGRRFSKPSTPVNLEEAPQWNR